MNTQFKAYLVQAAYDYCIHHGLDPYVVVARGGASELPAAMDQQDSVTYNLSNNAVRDFCLEDGQMSFSARFQGAVEQVCVAIDEIAWIGSPAGDGIGQAFKVELASVQLAVDGAADFGDDETGNQRLRVL